MQNGPLVIAWDIACPTSAKARSVRELLDREANLDAVQLVSVTGGGATQEQAHRLGDYFHDIRVEPRSLEEPNVLRVLFRRLPHAGRYWRDLMVRVLQSINHLGNDIAIEMAYRVEDSSSGNASPDRTKAEAMPD